MTSALDHYLVEADHGVALQFVEAVEHALHLLGDMPYVGSPRLAHELGLPELRALLVDGFPYLIFHVVHDDHIDVWRVLHASRDLPTIFGGTTDD